MPITQGVFAFQFAYYLCWFFPHASPGLGSFLTIGLRLCDAVGMSPAEKIHPPLE